MVSFLFFGRISQEKGFDLLFPFFREVATVRDDVRFFIFWDGPMKDSFFRAFSSLPHFYDLSGHPEAVLAEDIKDTRGGLYYFGHRKLPTISRFLEVADASVMPSRFLETFWLSALESLSVGVPVVCFAKWGLTEFIVSPDFCVLQKGDDAMLAKRIQETLENIALLSGKTQEANRKKALHIAKRFSESNWRASAAAHIGEAPKKILLVTDFSGSLGGIETHVQTIAATLADMGYEVEIFSQHVKKWDLRFRLSALWRSGNNTKSARKIHRRIHDFHPDIIWCHSLLRFMGPKVAQEIVKSDAKKFMTYHDLGYFAPFAAGTEREKDIPKDDWWEFYASAPILHKIFPVYLWMKYRKIHKLFVSLAEFDVHFVPAAFLLKPLSERLPRKAVKEVLPHFIKI